MLLLKFYFSFFPSSICPQLGPEFATHIPGRARVVLYLAEAPVRRPRPSGGGCLRPLPAPPLPEIPLAPRWSPLPIRPGLPASPSPRNRQTLAPFSLPSTPMPPNRRRRRGHESGEDSEERSRSSYVLKSNSSSCLTWIGWILGEGVCSLIVLIDYYVSVRFLACISLFLLYYQL